MTVLLTGVNVYFIRLLFAKLSKKRASGREKNFKRFYMLIVDILLVKASFDCNSRLKFSRLLPVTVKLSLSFAHVFIGIKEFIIKEIYISLVMAIDLLF